MSERHVTFDAIVAAVGATTGLTRTQIFSDVRSADAARARWAVWWVARQMTPLAYPVIGRLSRRDHSSVMHGVARAEEMRAMSEQFRIATDTILATLQQLEQAGMLALAETADPLAIARRVLRAPEREAVRVSIHEILAMALRLVELAETEPPPPAMPAMEAQDAA